MTALFHMLPRSLAALVLLLGAAASGLLQGCHAASNGPTIGFRNETDTVMKATFWVGERDVARPGGAKMRRAEEMNVAPNSRTRDSLMPMWHYRSAADTVVRMQIRPAVTSFNGPSEYWYELAPPSPYVVRAVKSPEGGFGFTREGRGAITPVPEEFWVRPE